jgi:hypothetical protein
MLDGTCAGGHAYVEEFDHGSYSCQAGYSFTNDTYYDATTYRNSSSSTTFTGHIDGQTSTQGGFGLNDTIVGFAWAEATGGSTCPSIVKGSFLSWERYFTTSGWGYVDNSTFNPQNDYSGLIGDPCWDHVGSVNSTGDFVVQ